MVVLLSVQPFLGFGVDLFKEHWGESALDLTAYAVVAVGAVGMILLAGRLWRRATWGERLWLGIGVLAYGIAALSTRIPQERLHYLGYGLLAGLLYVGLLRRSGGRWTRAGAGLTALLLGSGLGLLDEVLQIFWPRRYFDWRDVGTNVLSVGTGLMVAVPACGAWLRKGRTDVTRPGRSASY